MSGRVTYHSRNGFSLVELSIVLVILGLLTGGILGGQSLIHAAELRAITTEHEKWQTAVNTFKQKYFALPGDFTKAQDFWGADTWNGDGNGVVAIEDDASQVDQLQEHFLFWQHMALAGLIEGKYTGLTGSGSDNLHVLGENAPASRYSGGGWAIETIYDGGEDGFRYDYDYVNALLIGAPSPDETPYYPLFTPEDAWNIDTKFDDAKPGNGKIVSLFIDDCTTSTAMDDYDGDYALSTSDKACTLYFRNVF